MCPVVQWFWDRTSVIRVFLKDWVLSCSCRDSEKKHYSCGDTFQVTIECEGILRSNWFGEIVRLELENGLRLFIHYVYVKGSQNHCVCVCVRFWSTCTDRTQLRWVKCEHLFSGEGCFKQQSFWFFVHYCSLAFYIHTKKIWIICIFVSWLERWVL